MYNKTKILLLIFITSFSFSQTTGKIVGRIIDQDTLEPLIGANIILLNTDYGTASDINGDFFLINIPSGSYRLSLTMIGYKKTLVDDVLVSVNRTTPINLSMRSSVLEGDVIVVKADQVSIKKDQTSSIKNISSDQIDIMPVENIGQIIGMQAGIVAGHFRGGRSTEVTYLVDGIKVDEIYGGGSSSIELETGSVSELEIITGTFNAEYGKAMSGVVNQVTKSGGNSFEGALALGYGNYLTPNKDVFKGIGDLEANSNQDYQFNLSGPIIKDKINFFINYRLENNKNHLNGLHYFNPSDKSDYGDNSSENWKSEHTGDHTLERYCMDNRGIAILDNNNNFIFDEKIFLNEYGQCEFITSVCSYNNNIIPIDDELLCEMQYGGIYIEEFQTSISSSMSYCEHLNETLENSNEINNEVQSITFIPGLNIGYQIGKPHNSYVPLNNTKNSSLFSKISFHLLDDLRFSILYSKNTNNWKEYNHYYKYNPYGLPLNESASYLGALQWNYMFNQSYFIEGKHSYLSNYFGRYLFKDSFSANYISDDYTQGVPGFSTGGQDKFHIKRITDEITSSIKLNMQLNKHHSVKTGFDYSIYKINNKEYFIIPNPDSLLQGIYSAYTLPDSIQSPDDDIFNVEPLEYSLFIQDKAEYDEMVVNFGLRYDYFNPNVYYPSDYRNPANTISNVPQSDSLKAKEFTYWSPRLGIAYQVAEAAIVHFSYGHFYQMPPMYSMFSHSNWIVPTGNYETVLGNPNIKAEKTVTYEIGLWQKLNSLMSIEINMFYRDIYNLLGTDIWTTYNQVKYGLYSNKDYGNVRGLEIKYDFNYDAFSIFCNYTLQYTRGNADQPLQSFDREGGNKDPVSKLISMSWDQRHTFNTTLAYNIKKIGLTITGYYNSGTPYTFEPVTESETALINLLPNNDYKPANYTVDLTGYYKVFESNSLSTRLSFSIYNVFDVLNDMWVYPKTGRAYSNIVSETDILSYRSTFTDIYDQYKNPAMYSSPRNIKLMLTIDFK